MERAESRGCTMIQERAEMKDVRVRKGRLLVEKVRQREIRNPERKTSHHQQNQSYSNRRSKIRER